MKIALNTHTAFHSRTESFFAYACLQNAFFFFFLLVANMTAMSLVHEAEDASGDAHDQPAGANNEMLHEMGPRFTKPNIMTHAVIKPAGSTVHLSCPAEGEYIPYILVSNPHPFYSFRGLKNHMRITIACGLDSRSRAGFWKNDGAAVRAVRTIQYNNLLFYLLLIIIYYPSDSPSFITESLSVLRRDCARLLRKTRFRVRV